MTQEFELQPEEKLLFTFKPGLDNSGFHALILLSYLLIIIPLAFLATVIINEFFINVPVILGLIQLALKPVPLAWQAHSVFGEIALGIGILGVLAILCAYAWRLYMLSTLQYFFTNKRCVIVRKFININKHVIYYNRLADINMSQTLLGRIFNTATVTLTELSYDQALGAGNYIIIQGCTQKEGESIVDLVSQFIAK